MNTTRLSASSERLVSGVLGGTLVAVGLERRSLGGAALALLGGDLLYHGFTGESVIVRALGLDHDGDGAKQVGAPREAPEVERAITIGCSPQELYDLWRDPQQLPRVLGDFAEVTHHSKTRAHWRVHGPIGRELEFDTDIVDERPGEYVRWASTAGASVPNEGRVRFEAAPAGWGTVVTLYVRFDPPGGAVGDFIARHFAMVPRMAVERALRRFKSLAETGEMPTLAHNVSARGTSDLW